MAEMVEKMIRSSLNKINKNRQNARGAMRALYETAKAAKGKENASTFRGREIYFLPPISRIIAQNRSNRCCTVSISRKFVLAVRKTA